MTTLKKLSLIVSTIAVPDPQGSASFCQIRIRHTKVDYLNRLNEPLQLLMMQKYAANTSNLSVR
jgi:hypothetical protein